ncbi:uncharacterized protein Z518_07815 [Rhinocladiella mackenziei CBS 650.93]|uniref:HMG box domain-containing protein n=1 Tax=Rhinocladiella mackenziei CBS 650.93 TaxID=1442369 RepID=A0A0D2IM71_9EURO|nr:uncharacterized protein Z518_07815 [Rhinocladiella mackenziei CBS 650.93]KIX04261.1 hypothetical protein Z518_07815 [Rhinocladiella mackenziei CBS 650.93]
MTAAHLSSRTLSKQLLARSTGAFTRPFATNSLLRVNCSCTPNNEPSDHRRGYVILSSISKVVRSYATAAGKPVSKPKAHTGRVPAKSKRTAITTPRKAKSAKKSTKRAKKNTVKKTKPKGRKPPSKSALLQKARKEQAELRATALLDEPKLLPETAWTLVFAEEAKKHGDVKSKAAAAADKYKNLSAEERERYNHEANANKEKNAQAYKQWVQSYTPLEIKNANTARRQLQRKAKADGKKTTYSGIKDDRTVKLPVTAYAYFFQNRHASGDFKGVSIGEIGKLVGQEWKSLSSSEKQIYNDKADSDRNRYVEEYKTVYGIDAPRVRSRAT